MQGNTVAGFANIADAGAWQLAVPNGSYDVELAVGDATPGTDPTIHRINVEGQNAVNNFTITGTPDRRCSVPGRHQDRHGLRRLPDRRRHRRHQHQDRLHHRHAEHPDRRRPSPTGLTATAGDASVTLDWAANTDADLKGYNVFRGTADPVATTGTPLNGSSVLTASTFTDTTAANDTTYRYVVVAVDNADQSSVASDSVTATPAAANPTLATLPLKINFSDQRDRGSGLSARITARPYTNPRGRGWVVARHPHPAEPGRQRPAARRARRRSPPTCCSAASCTCRPTTSPAAFTGVKAARLVRDRRTQRHLQGDRERRRPARRRHRRLRRSLLRQRAHDQRRRRHGHRQVPGHRCHRVQDRHGHRPRHRRHADHRCHRRHQHQDQLPGHRVRRRHRAGRPGRRCGRRRRHQEHRRPGPPTPTPIWPVTTSTARPAARSRSVPPPS